MRSNNTKRETTFSSLFGQINARKSAKKFFLMQLPDKMLVNIEIIIKYAFN